jgi:hypothetical protein
VHGNLTWAGHTSPGGVIVRGIYAENRNNPDENRDNLILRHLRSRPNMQRDDALRVGYAKDIIIDHGSFTRANDEAAQVICALRYTLQNSIVAETIGGHFGLGGILVKYSSPAYPLDAVTLHHNLFTRLGGRFPQISGNDITAENNWRDVNGYTFHFPFRGEVAYNLYWDIWSEHTIGGSSTIAPYMLPEYATYRLNYVGNYAHLRPDRVFGFLTRIDDKNHPQPLYLAGNRISTSQLSDYQLIGNHGVGRVEHAVDCRTMGPVAVQTQRHPYPPTTPHHHAELPARTGRQVGPFPRDVLDRRLAHYVAAGAIDPSDPWGARREADGALNPVSRDQANTGAGTNPVDQEVTDLITGQRLHLTAGQLVDDAFYATWATPPPPPLDSDDDGMPDWWELHNGLDPLAQDHTGKNLSGRYTGREGYDNLECYLNRLSDHLTDGAPLTESSPWNYPVAVAATVSPTRITPGVATNVTITVLPSVPDGVAFVEVSAATLLAPYTVPSLAPADITAQRNGNRWTHTLTVPAVRNPGRYELLVHVRDTAWNHGYVVLPLDIGATEEPMTFAAWRTANFGGDAGNDAVSGPGADPDGCGLTNLARYAFALPARGPVASPVVPGTAETIGGRVLTLTFSRRSDAADLNYTVEASTDLVTWLPVPDHTYTPGTPATVTAEDIVPLTATSAPRRFLRLRITQQ